MQLLTLVLSVLKLVYHLPLVRMLSQSLTAVQPKGMFISTILSIIQTLLFYSSVVLIVWILREPVVGVCMEELAVESLKCVLLLKE